MEIEVYLTDLSEDSVEGGLGGFPFFGEGFETGLVDGDSGGGLSDGVFKGLGTEDRKREVSSSKTETRRGTKRRETERTISSPGSAHS